MRIGNYYQSSIYNMKYNLDITLNSMSFDSIKCNKMYLNSTRSIDGFYCYQDDESGITLDCMSEYIHYNPNLLYAAFLNGITTLFTDVYHHPSFDDEYRGPYSSPAHYDCNFSHMKSIYHSGDRIEFRYYTNESI